MGEYNVKTDPDCDGERCAAPREIIRVKTVLVHSGFNKNNYLNDIALLELAQPIQFNGNYVLDA